MAREMLINAADGDESRIAIVENGHLEELYVDRVSFQSRVGNIYKGRVTNVEPSIQAAFVDFGISKNGFLHISDVQPQYFEGSARKSKESVGRKRPRSDRPPIQECLRRSQEVVVQITKEGIGTKGPTLTTYVSLPGRFLVLMPGMSRLGVSRKIEDEEARRKLRETLGALSPPKNLGFIIRTAGLDRSKRELQRDLSYLVRLWSMVTKRTKAAKAPVELYKESDLVIRTLRDIYNSDISQIIVDAETIARRAREFLAVIAPRSRNKVKYYDGPSPLFHRYGIEQEIERINSRHVPLPSGGSLVIEQTEALVAIDVNSGRYREHDDAEETAKRTNLEGVKEIARQLRLRDLGGLIIMDFIDMRFEKNRRAVERALREEMKKDRARTKVLRMSGFCIVEMTRQRLRPSLKRSLYHDCPHCHGSGLVKTPESMSLDVMRSLQLASQKSNVACIEVKVNPQVAFFLQNRKRRALVELEEKTGRPITVRSDPAVSEDTVVFDCQDARGSLVKFEP